jgi:hydrogenase expression/formation protein HypE
MPHKKILLSHGSGGRLAHNLIKDMLLKRFPSPILKELADSARISCSGALAFTTDSFVVSPLEFSGGDIGKLSVCGTVNDLVMLAAQPRYLSLAFIVEEGLDLKAFERIVESISLNAKKARVEIATGDLKVVEKGACDKIFINTSGVGEILKGKVLSFRNILPGDKIIITGQIGQHGLSVLAKRKELDLGFNIQSDCAALNDLLIPVLEKTGAIRFMRDPTRGGVATVLNEVAEQANLGILIDEKDIPICAKVRTACELLGIDPLYVANEGRAVLIVKKGSEKNILALLKRHPLGRNAKIVGCVTRENRGKVILNTMLGTRRIVDMLTSEPLPRIC